MLRCLHQVGMQLMGSPHVATSAMQHPCQGDANVDMPRKVWRGL